MQLASKVTIHGVTKPLSSILRIYRNNNPFTGENHIDNAPILAGTYMEPIDRYLYPSITKRTCKDPIKFEIEAHLFALDYQGICQDRCQYDMYRYTRKGPTEYQMKYRDGSIIEIDPIPSMSWDSFCQRYSEQQQSLVQQYVSLCGPIFYGMPLAEAEKYLGTKKLRRVILVKTIDDLYAAIDQLQRSVAWRGLKFLSPVTAKMTDDELVNATQGDSLYNRYLAYCEERAAELNDVTSVRDLQKQKAAEIEKVKVFYDNLIEQSRLSKQEMLKKAPPALTYSAWLEVNGKS